MHKALLEKLLAKPGCTSFSAAPRANLVRADKQLGGFHFASIPADYISFLNCCDGLFYDGLELLGIDQHLRPDKQYTFANLVEVNRSFAEYEFFLGKLIIGRLSEHFIIYDGHNGFFAIVDRVNLCSMVEFSDFNRLMSAILQLCDTAD